ncbi:molybdenum ABC transporter ATP-binding protein [bacterium]|nr:molybdenum ABC transporter ATP-binding protein [bacterium]
MLELDFKFLRENFSLEVKLDLKNTVTGIFGVSGSGKSSLLNVVSGLLNAQEGKILLNGKTLFSSKDKIILPPNKRKIGYVFQDNQLFPHFSVRNNLLYGYKLVEKNQRRFELDQIIDLLELEPLLFRFPQNISGGEKQRVALGRALLSSPELLLLDEPLASLDEKLKRQILPFLKKIREKIPFLYVSHSISEILQLTEQLVILDKGKILACGEFLEVIKNGEFLKLGKSFGLENVLVVEVLRNETKNGFTVGRLGKNEVKLPLAHFSEGEKITVSVRPEDIALANEKIYNISIQNQLEGEIFEIKQVSESMILVEVDVGAVIFVEISLKALQDLELKIGKKIFCLIKTQAFLHLTN